MRPIIAPSRNSRKLLLTTVAGLLFASPLHAADALLQPTEIRKALEASNALREHPDPCAPALATAHASIQSALAALEAYGTDLDVRRSALHNELGLLRGLQADCPAHAQERETLRREARDAYARAIELEPVSGLGAADRAVYLYNHAQALAAAGDSAGAVARLREVLALELEFGLRDAYAEDRQVLQRLLEDLAPDSPERLVPAPELPAQDKVTLAYRAPLAAGGRQVMSARNVSYADGKQSTQSMGGQLRIEVRREGEHVVSRATDYAPDQPADEGSARISQILERVIVMLPRYVSDLKGQLVRIDNLDRATEALREEIEKPLGDLKISSAEQQQLRDEGLALLRQYLRPEVLFAQAAVTASYSGPFWDGGELDHGDWYHSPLESAEAVQPGTVRQGHRFKFSRRLPCTPAGGNACVELVLIVDWSSEDLQRATLSSLASTTPGLRDQIASLEMFKRTVYTLQVEPATLLVHDWVEEEIQTIESRDKKGNSSTRVTTRRQKISTSYDSLKF